MAQLIKEWFMSCEQGIRESQINGSLTHSPLQNLSEHNFAPEDATETDLVPALPLSGGSENIVTARDGLLCYLIA